MSGEIIRIESAVKIGQRVEFYLEDNDEKYLSRIEDITPDELIVAMPLDEKRRPIIPAEGENLYGQAVGKQCVYKFFSIYKDKALQPIPVWHISKPPTVEKRQNREFVRVRTALPLKIRLVAEDGSLQQPQITTTVDISGNGICFMLQKPVTVGSSVALEMNSLPEIGTVKIMTEVARCMEIRVSSEHLYHVGVRFLHLPRQIQNKLVRFIFDLQRRDLARGVVDL